MSFEWQNLDFEKSTNTKEKQEWADINTEERLDQLRDSYKTTKIEFYWDEKVWTIDFVQQVHTTREATKEPELKEHIWKFQYEIYKHLVESWVKHVFVEWFDYDCDSFDKNLLRLIEKAEKSWDMDEIYKIFSMPGWAGLIYATTNKWVKLHKVCTQEEKNRTMNIIYRDWWLDLNKPEHVKIQDEREDYALREIMSFLKENPWENVALVYWADHNFTDNFERIPEKHKHMLPSLETTEFPNLEKQANELLDKILAERELENSNL